MTSTSTSTTTPRGTRLTTRFGWRHASPATEWRSVRPLALDLVRLLAERRPRRLGKLGDGPLLPRRPGRLLDVLARRPPLSLRRRHHPFPFRRGGTLAPFFRASESPMAIACFRLLARGCRPFPALSVPCFCLRVALATDRLAPLPYLRPRVDLRFFMVSSYCE